MIACMSFLVYLLFAVEINIHWVKNCRIMEGLLEGEAKIRQLAV